MTPKSIGALVAAAALTGCASRASSVEGSYISPLQFTAYNCDQIKMEMFRVANRVRLMSRSQDRIATTDAVAISSAVLFPPSLLFASWGRDKKEELANLKGQYDALTDAAIDKNCPIAEELKATEQQAGVAPTPPVKR